MAAKRKEKIENDTRALIKLITGFQENSENFHLCLTFAESNFKYHRFLTPDSHKIHRVINGLCEKFEVHSQKQKATDLKELTSAFLEQPGLDGRQTGKTDVHYALLLLLLELANSPIKTDFERKQKNVVPVEVDNFDWKSFLLNDLNLNFISYASSSSDGDEVSEDSSTGEEEEFGNPERHSRQQSLSVHVPPQVSPSAEATLSRTEHNSLTGDEYTKLEQALVVEYWKGKGKEDDVSGGHSASNLVRDWNFYKEQLSLFHSTTSKCVVTEQQVLKESMWMLSGITNLFIFKFSSNEFSLNPDIYVMHLTNECLDSSLKPLMRKANQLCALQSFVTDVISQVTSAIQCGRQSGIPQTYQAFATCVSQFLSDFRARLLELEKVIMKQEELMSMAMLSSKLQTWFDKIQTVHSVYVSGVASVSSENTRLSSSNCFKASHLLDILYQTLFELDLISLMDQTNRKNVIMEMLIKSSQPLIEITSVWISNGQLIDPAEEFVIQRNKEIKSLDETFWEKAFVSNHISPPEDGITFSKASEESSNQEAPHMSKSITTNKNITIASIMSEQVGSESIEFIVSHGPKLLQPILADAILTGKSMEMLENLGKMGEVQDTSLGVFERPPSLFELFVSDLRAKVGEKTNSQQVSMESASVGNLTKINHKDSLLTKPLQMKGANDSLLTINSAALFNQCKILASKTETDRCLPNVRCGLSPLLKICESCLYPHMRARYQTVCLKLVHILKTEYHLISCIQAMQRYYLMSSGEIMYDFYTQIFHKMQKKEEWKEPALLEMYLHEAISPKHPSDVSRLSVVVKSPSLSQDKSPISATDCINLRYNVPWPLNVVISGKCQELYNNIFCFLLQVKRAKYVQDELKFKDLAREQSVARSAYEDDNETIPRHKRIHRCQLFRFRLLYFINSLHNYVMTRILHSTGLEFASQLEGATDLEQIIAIHRGYVQAIHERCLLHQKLSILKEAVMKVLNLSLTFSLLWRQGVDFIHGESILNMETELMRCIHFLAAFLNNVIKRGSFPHLESLALALVSSLQNVDL